MKEEYRKKETVGKLTDVDCSMICDNHRNIIIYFHNHPLMHWTSSDALKDQQPFYYYNLNLTVNSSKI
uniref:Uncharacterized protein n=1 Tax=Onchocerca volvulus TaxID=6282 RepID=A0A8R1Y368_ONCVO